MSKGCGCMKPDAYSQRNSGVDVYLYRWLKDTLTILPTEQHKKLLTNLPQDMKKIQLAISIPKRVDIIDIIMFVEVELKYEKYHHNIKVYVTKSHGYQWPMLMNRSDHATYFPMMDETNDERAGMWGIAIEQKNGKIGQ